MTEMPDINKSERPSWYYKKEKWEPSADELDEFMKTLKDKHGKKMMRFVIFENLSSKDWFCRKCAAKELEDAKLPSGQYAGGGGIQGLERGQSSLRPGCELENGKRNCRIHGNTAHDRWTGFFKPNFSQGSVPSKLQEKIFEMNDFKDAIENRTREHGGLMIDHKFPRGEFNVPDDIPYNEILSNLISTEKSKKTAGKEQCKKYFQILKKDIVGNHNKMKTEFCATCCTCPACEKELSDHTDEQLAKCSKSPAKTPGSRDGKRGILFGIKFWYKGTEDWPAGVPRKGIEAEKGCEGCGWYDVEKWRDALNKQCGS